MKSAKIEVSYFAAGIVAHLASDSFESWNLPTVPKEEITDELTVNTLKESWEKYIYKHIKELCYKMED